MTSQHPLAAHLAHLPQSIQDLLPIIGVDAALALVNARGGIAITVPLDPKPGHWMSAIIGYPELQALSANYGGEQIEVPRCHRALQAAREQQILADVDAGHTINSIALRHGYTRRGINKMRERHRNKPDNQPDLFQ